MDKPERSLKIDRQSEDKALFDKIACRYAKKDSVPSSSAARKAVLYEALGDLRTSGALGAIVEIGCGAAATASYLKGRYTRYIGLDQSPEMIKAARRFNDGNNSAEFIADNAKLSSVADNTADIVLSIGVLHHVADIEDLLLEVRRIAKPGGLFIAVEPQRGNPIIQLMRSIRKFVDKSYSKDQVCFCREELQSLAARSLSPEIEFSYQGYFTPVFAQVILNPQAIFYPLSKAAVHIDLWLNKALPSFSKKMSFNIIMRVKIIK